MTTGMRMAYMEQSFREILTRLCTIRTDEVKVTIINNSTQKTRTRGIARPARSARGLLEAEMNLMVTLLDLVKDNLPEVYLGIKELYDTNTRGVIAIEMILSCGKIYQITANIDPKFGVTNSDYPKSFINQMYNEASMIFGNFYVVV